jgi:hypothetical protein
VRDGPEKDAYERACAAADELLPVLDARLADFAAQEADLAARVRAAEWGMTKDVFGLESPVVPPEYEGLRGDIQRAAARRSAVLYDIEKALGLAVGAGLLIEGDRLRSPLCWGGPELIVAEILNEHAGQLRTVIATSDGRYVATEAHEWAWDDETKSVVRDPDVVGVRFEHWWVGGCRVGGTAHPASRRVLDADPIR